MRRTLRKGLTMVVAIMLLLSFTAAALADTVTSTSFILPGSRITSRPVSADPETPSPDPEAPDETLTEPDEPLDLYVTVSTNLADMTNIPDGTIMVLTAHLSDDFAKLPAYELQWQMSEDGSSWTDIDGETSETLTRVLTVENDGFYWRVNVLIPD